MPSAPPTPRPPPPLPPSPRQAVAPRAADLATAPARLKLIGASAAGHGFPGALGPGETVRISTGAPVPAGADAVLIQENAETPDAATVVANEPVTVGNHIRPAGLDFAEGAALLEAGRTFGLRELGLAAAMGYGEVSVRRRPRVAILSTGDELVPPGALPGPDQIVSSNAVSIAALVDAAGGAATDLGIAVDDPQAIAGAIDAAVALPADVLVTIGGASVGDHDLVQDALTGRGMDLGFWRIAMRPGKPLMFGHIPRSDGGPPLRVLGLPGNPVSSMVCSILFLRPLIDALLGRPQTDPSEAAVLGADVGANDMRQDYVRATLAPSPDGLPVATPLPRQDSSMLSILGAADCLLIRPPHASPAAAGAPCRIIRLP
jgi:molybdopterin molybdotransferase